MRAILILAVAAFAAPAMAQTPAGAHGSVPRTQPACALDGTCPTLAATVARQLGMPAAPAAMGGPYEPVMTDAPRPAPTAGDYPPCRPGPGDDRCIQLYERGRQR